MGVLIHKAERQDWKKADGFADDNTEQENVREK